MGLFASLKSAASQANEDAHAARLSNEFSDTVLKMKVMDRSISDEIIRRFVHKRGLIKHEMANWTDDGKLKMSRKLRQSARETTDFNVTEGYALWMASAWLESSVRQASKAFHVFAQLDDLAAAHESIGTDAVPNLSS